jgi:uncharacterized protein (TIGR02001 family)
MKATLKNARLLILALLVSSAGISTVSAQEESESPFSVGADFVSRYVWRGLDFGNAPAIQPTIEFAAGNFAIGAWGSYTISASPYLEADLYAGYAFDFGLSVLVTDYYFPAAEFGGVTDSSYFDIDSHVFEIGLSQEIGDFYISAFYFLNLDSDFYVEAGYSFEHFSLFAGAGNQSYTSDGEFMVTNIGISTSKEIRISDTFELPVTGAFIVNPELEQVNIVFGFSL